MTFAETAAQLPDVGVAITFSSAIEETLRLHADLIDAVEIEPQTTWVESPAEMPRYRSTPYADAYLSALPFRKLVHSIGLPVGGSADHDPDQVRLLRQAISGLEAPWVSEHLSFNSSVDGYTGFFLPPRQTSDGVDRCIASIKALQRELDVPLSVETGVNYLRARPDEMHDGDFVSAVVEGADCGILLDLHNVYTNSVNGRQSVEAFVDQIDLRRVVEVHIAGGMQLDGFWLDAHSGAIPSELFEPARDVIASLPNLRAIVFEIFPAFVDSVGPSGIARELERVNELWSCRRTTPLPEQRCRPMRLPVVQETPAGPTAAEWERDLATLVVGQEVDGGADHEFGGDAGVTLLNKLSLEFRASMITRNLRRTTRLLLLSLGEDVFRVFLREHAKRNRPQFFGATEALGFATFLEELDLSIPQFDMVLRFETATLRTRIDNVTRVVEFEYDPFPMLLALADGHLPTEYSQVGHYEIEITGDDQRESLVRT